MSLLVGVALIEHVSVSMALFLMLAAFVQGFTLGYAVPSIADYLRHRSERERVEDQFDSWRRDRRTGDESPLSTVSREHRTPQ